MSDDGTEWSCEISTRTLKLAGREALITLEHVSVPSLSGRHRLQDVSLEVTHGEALAIVGPSGAGKTTLLYVMAGLCPASGVRRAQGLSEPGSVGMLFQDDVLFDWMSVAKNLDILLSLHNGDPVLRKAKAQKVLADVGIGDPLLLRRTPKEPSLLSRSDPVAFD